jgi:hypothetical protein
MGSGGRQRGLRSWAFRESLWSLRRAIWRAVPLSVHGPGDAHVEQVAQQPLGLRVVVGHAPGKIGQVPQHRSDTFPCIPVPAPGSRPGKLVARKPWSICLSLADGLETRRSVPRLPGRASRVLNRPCHRRASLRPGGARSGVARPPSEARPAGRCGRHGSYQGLSRQAPGGEVTRRDRMPDSSVLASDTARRSA